MLPGILGLIVVAFAAVVLAAPRASRRLRNSRVARPAGGPPARPVPQPAGRAAAPVEIQPSSVMTEPYAYDDGVMTGRPDEEDS